MVFKIAQAWCYTHGAPWVVSKTRRLGEKKAVKGNRGGGGCDGEFLNGSSCSLSWCAEQANPVLL